MIACTHTRRQMPPPAPGNLRSGDVVRSVPHLTYRQLDHWRSAGAVTATVDATGSGEHCQWSTNDVECLIVIASFVHTARRWFGCVPVPTIRYLWDGLKERGAVSILDGPIHIDLVLPTYHPHDTGTVR